MSGHSKWSTIKRKKGAMDSKRSKIFSKIVKEITVAVKEGGPDPDANPRLRLAISNAKGVNMPKDNIQRAITKAGKDSANFQQATYEGYAPGGIAVYIECLTDNNNRTISNIRAVFSKYGGSIENNGSLNYLFDRKGIFTIQKADFNVEEFELEIIDSGVEDVEHENGVIIITTALEDFGNVQKKLEEMQIKVENAELSRIPNNTKSLDVEAAKKVIRMIDNFEDDDDVQNVYHNLEMTDELESEINRY